MKITVHITYDEIVKLRDEWRDLLRQSAFDTIFLTWEWQTAWWRSFQRDRKLQVLAVREDAQGALVGLAPFFLDTDTSGRRAIQFIGGVDVSDYMDILAATDAQHEVYNAIAGYLREKASSWDILDLHNIPACSPTRKVFAPLVQAQSFSTQMHIEERCPQMPLTNDWESYLGLLKKKDRHELRRKIRRLERDAESWKWYASDQDSLTADIEHFFDLHKKSTPDKEHFMDPSMESYFRDLAEVLLGEGWLKLYFLEINGERAASVLCFDYADTIYVYNSGYDPRFAPLSAGIISIAFCVQDAIRMGRKRFDLLRGDEPYKYDFGAVDLFIYRLVVDNCLQKAKGIDPSDA